jgi:hypothetical protein
MGLEAWDSRGRRSMPQLKHQADREKSALPKLFVSFRPSTTG